MSIEAMKKALEAAYLAGFYRSGEGYNSDYPFSNKGLDPLDDPYWIESRDAYVRTAIEQAEKQEPVAWMYVNEDMPTNRQLEWTETHHGYAGNWLKHPLYAAPPAAQEPAAYKWKGELFTPGEIEMLDVDDAVPLYAAPIESKQEPVAFRWKGDLFTNPVPLYEHPRQWVGLTSREIWACNRTGESDPEFHICMAHQNLVDFALAIEAKLKEKNFVLC
jgi:hypothetical protein